MRRHLLERSSGFYACDEQGVKATFNQLSPSRILAHAGLRPQFAVKVMTLVQ